MKYRHEHHAGNFADVHKHVTLLALLAALKRKDKGFLYLETHAGRGAYDLAGSPGESASGIGRLEVQRLSQGTPPSAAEEIRHYATAVAQLRRERRQPRLYPGSPLLAAGELRPQDRAVLIEQQPAETRALERALSDQVQGRTRPPKGEAVPFSEASLRPPSESRAKTTLFDRDRAGPGRVRRMRRTGGHGWTPRAGPVGPGTCAEQGLRSAMPDPALRLETGDGFERLRAWLPPPERRGLTFLDPPYEESRQDFERVRRAAGEALRRFHTGVVAVWYPIKDERDTAAWRSALARELDCELLAAELTLYPPDSRVALNGSGMLILNPPYQLAERMEIWLPQLHAYLDTGHGGTTNVRRLRA